MRAVYTSSILILRVLIFLTDLRLELIRGLYLPLTVPGMKELPATRKFSMWIILNLVLPTTLF